VKIIVTTATFKGISIFLGVIFSLGSSSFIGNMIAGYTMTYRRAYKLGDRIRVNDIEGDVVEMRLLVTHLRTVKNEEIVVPNSLILNSHVINYTTLARSRGLILHTAVSIGYEVPDKWRLFLGWRQNVRPVCSARRRRLCSRNLWTTSP